MDAVDEYKATARSLDSAAILSGSFVDLAASDGYSCSMMWPLLTSGRWSGLCVEMDPHKFAKLSHLYSRFDDVSLARQKVTPLNVCGLLEAHLVRRDFELLNLDIDSYDLAVLAAILDGGFRPRVISLEINEKIPPPILFEVKYDDQHYWNGDHFYGCSLASAQEASSARGYVLLSMVGSNAQYVEKSVAPQNIRFPTPEEAYDTGYRKLPDRSIKFSYNSDVRHWLEVEPAHAESQIREFFSKYDGKFKLSRE